MDFKELLKPGVTKDLAVIKLLMDSGFPVVLYGATVDVADQITKKLATNNIKIEVIAFDEDSPMMTKSTTL